MNQDSTLDIQDYLDASSDAANRTRTVAIVLVVASVLTFVGFLNSLENTWMIQRVRALSKSDSTYVATKLGKMPQDPKEKELYEKHYNELYVAMIRSYVDNTFTIRVPFFGIAFDVNYLGVLGGLGFVIILILFRFCLSREIQNLELSFNEAKDSGQLRIFYQLLAMRQVLTTPLTDKKARSKTAAYLPKLLCLLPFLVHLTVTANDFRTSDIVGNQISPIHTLIILVADVVFLFGIIVFTIACFKRWMYIDTIWDRYWDHIK